jgi:hypothetical protein
MEATVNTAAEYGIVLRRKGARDTYFAGFDRDGLPFFSTENDAVSYADRLHAEAQASLLIASRTQVQRRAVVLNG